MSASLDPHDLERFVAAQEPVFDAVRRELAAGRKRTHWMWFVYPQVDGLGSSPMARRYAIRSLAEARAYLAHPVLGPRLRACCALVCGHAGSDVLAMFGSPDHLKLRSSVTLFGGVAEDAEPFEAVLAAFFDGEGCGRTLEVVAGWRAVDPGSHAPR
ncbi:MAG: DUF1810 domain-containing protein [Trueperaceae bacterium]|nr:MAG: DUF1810 domain-containing protein [Trueperaceae bacterium]